MRIVATSDCHGHLTEAELPPGDVLVLAGDVLLDGGLDRQRADLARLDEWFASLVYRKVVLVAGNHDWLFERDKTVRPRNAIYLEDAGAVIDGVRFWGSPWQPEFCDWAFNLPRDSDELREVWSRIPVGTDVLVTHGPPHGIMDRPWGKASPAGCALLRERVREVKPRVHIFGHIHAGYGKHHEEGTWFLNVALCDESYEPVQPPLVIDL
ncbi:MAG TPA: metallophosphoesterase [Planctomycetota bacterium]|nr:metallophosphoesterase [Planctomycetota bacterium]